MGCSPSRPDRRTRPATSRVSEEHVESPPQGYNEEEEFYDPNFDYGYFEEEEETYMPFPTFMMQAERKIFEYDFIKQIGHGTHAVVYLVNNFETNVKYAAKVYDKNVNRTLLTNTNLPPPFIREIKLMAKIKNRHCISLNEVLDDEQTNTLIIIQEFADAGPLLPQVSRTTPFPEQKAKSIFFEICQGVRYLHSINVAHRDIKPENIFKFSDGHVAIGDYSNSLDCDGTEFFDDSEGTPAFMSPEQCLGKPFKGRPCDVWASGVTLYLILFGEIPFFFSNECISYSTIFQVSQRIINEELKFPDSSDVSDDAKDLILHMLCKNPDERYTINDVLRHKWFQDLPDRNEVLSNLSLSPIPEVSQ